MIELTERRKFMKTQRFLKKPHLPEGRVTAAVVNYSNPQIHNALCSYNIYPLGTHACKNLSAPVQLHADMLMNHICENIIILAKGESYLEKELSDFGYKVFYSEKSLKPSYPDDSILNCFSIGSHLFGNLSCVSEEIKKICLNKNLTQINVKQGYTKCSTAIVSENAFITADDGIFNALKLCGFDVLKIQPGFIKLDGYKYGFIGGCCGLIDKNVLAFTGNVLLHPDGKKIEAFIKSHGVDCISLTEGQLEDIGGILPITEEK